MAAEDLDRVVCHLARDLGRQQLGLRDLSHGILALVPLLRRLVDEGLDRRDLRPHVDELVLDHLKVRDRLAERLALQGVILRVLEHPVRPRDRTGGGDHPLPLQLPHQVLESLAFLADQVADRDVAVLEQQLGGVGGVHAELLQRARDLEALGPFLDDQQVVAGVSTVAFDLGHDERPLTAGSVRDEDLSTIDDELVAVSLRGGRDSRDVRSGVRFGDGDGGDVLSADGGRQPAPLLLLGPELEHRRGRHLRLDGDRHAQAAGRGFRHLLGQHDGREVVAALSAELLRVPQAEETELAHPLEDRVGEGLLLPLLEVRLHLFLQELADVEAELFVRVGEVHVA